MFSTGSQGTPPGRSGRTAIVAHKRTLEWMSADHWIQADARYEHARPKAARPTETFLANGSLKTGGEQIDYGYLALAHTNGDIYVHFRNANILAVGDVASPLRDPALDYVTGAWIGGRVDSMDVLLARTNEQTRIVPAYGPVLSKAEFKAERDMMEEVRKRDLADRMSSRVRFRGNYGYRLERAASLIVRRSERRVRLISRACSGA
jgi:glyoxylase-like metal-dependent hydrolase (beta-lactamase superfamily II)